MFLKNLHFVRGLNPPTKRRKYIGFLRVVNEFARRYCLLQCLKCIFVIRNCGHKDLSPAHSATFTKLVKVCTFFPSEWKILESPAKFLDGTHFNIRCHPTQYCRSSYFPFRLSLTLHIWTFKKNHFLFFTC
jgi:hypothetical protein